MEPLFDVLYKHIKRSRIEPIQAYLEQGGDPNLRQTWTLLMVAAHFGNSKILKLLLDHGADLETEGNVEGLTALAFAASAGRTKCVQLLIERGASVHVRPHGAPLATYIRNCGGPYPNVDKLLAATQHQG
ncbi:MAG: ankyrin repeat domain-containing protein [Fimbriimonadaceae bacterium]